MKQYTLIKWYPSLPKCLKEGTKVIRFLGDDDFVSCCENCPKSISQHEVINNPEFWEKGEEKDYEILSFKDPQLSGIVNKSWNGLFRYDVNQFYYENECISKGFKIHSVKRLSDGEVFTIGDKIKSRFLSNKIIQITIDETFGLILSTKTHDIGIDQIQHVENPLFTTADGVEMFEGDEYYAVCPKTYEIHWSVADEYSISRWLKFSTKAKAERWVLENETKYSLNQIKEAIEDSILTVNKPTGHVYINKQRVFKKLME